MTDFSKMSDYEINCLVLLAKGRQVIRDSSVDLSRSQVGVRYDHERMEICAWEDPCNNPADAWPIITANRIVIVPLRHCSEWIARCHGLSSKKHANPLRAAMISFLMMKDSENA